MKLIIHSLLVWVKRKSFHIEKMTQNALKYIRLSFKVILFNPEFLTVLGQTDQKNDCNFFTSYYLAEALPMRPGIGTSYYFLPFSYHMIIFLLNYSPRKRNKCEVGPTEICHSARYLSIFIVLCLDQRLYYKGYSFIMSYYFRPFWTPFIPHLSLDYPLYPPSPVQWALMLRIVKIRCYLFCTVIGVSAALH